MTDHPDLDRLIRNQDSDALQDRTVEITAQIARQSSIRIARPA
jgi:hypothetical protein